MNKFGLKRGQLTAKQKEFIRKRDGFGCVHCGRGLYTYEHFSPPFKDAEAHNVDGIALLCGQCQLSTTKGILSKETIQDDVKNPFCRRVGYQNDFFDLKIPSVRFGNFEFYTSKGSGKYEILKVNGELTLGFSDDPAGGPLLLSATFRDKNNNIYLEIDKNEWRASVDNWDIKQKRNKLNIFHDNKEIGIGIEFNPPHEINFTSFITYFNKNKLSLDKQGLVITRVDGQESRIFTPDIVRRSGPIIIKL